MAGTIARVRTQTLSFLVIVGLIVALLVFLGWRRSARRDALREYLAASGFRSVGCPIAAPFGERPMASIACWSGRAREKDVPFVLVLGTRWREGVVQQTKARVLEMHVGVYLPSEVSVSKAFRGKTAPEGGHLLTWETDHTPDRISKHIEEAISAVERRIM